VCEYWRKGEARGTGTRAAAALGGRVQGATTLLGKLKFAIKKYFIHPINFKCLSQIKSK
jgi:hypothetical protein